jgi:hypothetical protein
MAYSVDLVRFGIEESDDVSLRHVCDVEFRGSSAGCSYSRSRFRDVSLCEMLCLCDYVRMFRAVPSIVAAANVASHDCRRQSQR